MRIKQQCRYSHSLIANHNNARRAAIFYPMNASSSSLAPSCFRIHRPCCGSYYHGATFATSSSDVNLRGGERVMDNRAIYGLLKLSKFTKSEFNWRFDRIIQAGIDRDDRLEEEEQQQLLSKRKNNVQKQEEDKKQSNENIPSSQQQLARRDAMSLHDLEAYLLERYQRIEEEYNSIQSTTKKHHDTVTMQRIQQCSTEDAAFIFHWLLQHAPIDTRKSSNILQTANTFTTSNEETTIFLTKYQFRKSLQNQATHIHYPTILPLSASMLLVGLSVGVTSPIMPFIATKLELSSTVYGVVISSFAFSKMMGNVPFSILVERYGRKRFLVHPLWLVGLGVAGMGLSTDWVQLSMCRMTVGLGVAALTTASTLFVADVSTPLNRASTFSPLMSAFAAGMALGPAIGGFLHDAWGIRDTFFAVGLSYSVASIWNHVSVQETKRTKEWYERDDCLPWHTNGNHVGETDNKAEQCLSVENEHATNSLTTTISQAVKDTTKQWTALLQDPRVYPVVINNGFYMLALSGTQFTLLPLILTGGGATDEGLAVAGLALSASAVGQLYMLMSGVQVLGNPLAGRFADRMGKNVGIVTGGILTSFGMACVPAICAYSLASGDASSLASDVNWPLLAGTLGIWSLGGTLLATSHVSTKTRGCVYIFIYQLACSYICKMIRIFIGCCNFGHCE